MDHRNELLFLKAQNHAFGTIVRLLLAQAASGQTNAKEWLNHIQSLAEKEMKGTVAPDLSDDDSLFTVRVGVASIKALFENIETGRGKPPNRT